MAFIIAGLGNPGEEYSGTRHNTGRIITELIARRFECAEWKENKKLKALRAFGKAEKDRVEFVLPNTFMNKSLQLL